MNKFAKQIEKAKEKGQGYATVRRDVVKRLIEKGEFHRLVCNHSYTDDYAWDAATNFGKGEVKDIEAVVKWLEQKTHCYIDVNNPNEVRILPYQGLSYSLFLEAPEPKYEDLHECEGEALCDDKNVIDFTARLKVKKESEQMERLKESFFRMFGDQPQHVLRDIAQSIADKDEERYMELTEPIIMKKAIKHFNKGGF
ncbi:hypothetical protein H7K13_23715 [Priestia aryabhattai]|uniref:hypothetical protein n=1 Tax=Priestia aryabhattai TaxID=412384 RepID=UPI001C8D2F19|nr:hypothetical protein [Priestia aryabhattai]MBY0077938.1 hypothetical protein [Priestia aryabhattai]